jgi:hypothetical protein
MVINGNGKYLFSPLLADYIIIEEIEDLGWLRQLVKADLRRL